MGLIAFAFGSVIYADRVPGDDQGINYAPGVTPVTLSPEEIARLPRTESREDRVWRDMKRQESQWIRDEINRIERETDERLDAMEREQQRFRDANEFGSSGYPDFDSIIRNDDLGRWDYEPVSPGHEPYDSGVPIYDHLFRNDT